MLSRTDRDEGKLAVRSLVKLGQVCLLIISATMIVNFSSIVAGHGAAYAQSSTFSRVDVVGNQRIDPDTIRVYAGVTPGQSISAEDLNAGLRRLFDTGIFEDVTFTPQGSVLVINVVENPTINFINFEGNDKLDDETLGIVINLRERQAYSRAVAEEDAQRIIEAYTQSGNFNAVVTPVIIRLEDNRVNLVYEITEGRPTRVQRISIIGNQVYSDNRLRRAIETGQAGLFSFLTNKSSYDQARLELDQQLLREFYLERGYVDFEVRSTTVELAPERNGFFVSFTIKEGEQYRIGDISLNLLAPRLNEADFEGLVKIEAGDVYAASEVETSIERLSLQAGEAGYAFVTVNPRITKNDADRTIDIEFELADGPRVFIERIDIRGNTQTLDRVIRRQFYVQEGDPFNARELRRAEGRIQSLSFFETVQVGVREGSAPDRAVITVEVEEAPTGSLSFGASYGSSAGIVGTISLQERNFLGRGQTVGFEINAGDGQQVYAVNFTEPALFDQDLRAGFDLFYRNQKLDESSVDTRRIGFVPRIEFPLTEYSRLSLRYNLIKNETNNDDFENTSPVLLAEDGKYLTSGLGYTYQLDRRNSPIDPSAGWIFTFSQDFAGLGGDRDYLKSSLSTKVYRSFFNEDVIFSAEAEAGYLYMFNDEVSNLGDRFSAGGDSLRGFARGGIGPRDRCRNCIGDGDNDDLNDSLGGNSFALLRLEASFPIGLPAEYGVYGGVFADVGSVWGLNDGIPDGASGPIDDSLYWRSAVGVSLFWESPLGPLRFNFAQPIDTQPGDETEVFRFTVDSRF